jgi:hypothetical protein
MSMAGTLIHDEVRIEKKLTVRSLWSVICCEDLILGFFMMLFRDCDFAALSDALEPGNHRVDPFHRRNLKRLVERDRVSLWG